MKNYFKDLTISNLKIIARNAVAATTPAFLKSARQSF
jgi:hypothetical protein